jgi:hypothetical protein
MKQWKQSFELEMVWWRLNLKWSLMKIGLEMVSDEDWTWNGLWWRLDLKWSLMKIGLEMVSDEDWTWNGLWRSWTWNGLWWRLNFKWSLMKLNFKWSLMNSFAIIVLLMLTVSSRKNKSVKSYLLYLPFMCQNVHLKCNSRAAQVSDEDWTWNGLWWRLDLKWSLMKIGLEMVSDEDWTWNSLWWRLDLK